MKWAHYDATGKVLYTGECPDGMEAHQPIPPGCLLFLGEIDPWDSVDLDTGARIQREKPEPSYREKRRAAYPTVEAQLDALWHAMDRGDLPRAPEFFNMIKRVKDAHPNPNAIGVTEL